MQNRKKSIGKEIIDGLTEFAEALETGAPISGRFTCRRIMLDLQPTDYDAVLVRKTRQIIGASQALFGQFLGVSASTVRAWEQGINTPNDIAQRFMDEIRRDPEYWRNRFRNIVVAKKDVLQTTLRHTRR